MRSLALLVDPGTDLEDERPTPVGSPSSAVDESVPLSAASGVDLELARSLLEVGVLPAMVTPIGDPEVGSSMTPATYRNKSLLCQVYIVSWFCRNFRTVSTFAGVTVCP